MQAMNSVIVESLIVFLLLPIISLAQIGTTPSPSYVFDFSCRVEEDGSGATALVCPNGRYKATGNVRIDNGLLFLGRPRSTVAIELKAPPGFLFKPGRLSVDISSVGFFRAGESCGMFADDGKGNRQVHDILYGATNGKARDTPGSVLPALGFRWAGLGTELEFARTLTLTLDSLLSDEPAQDACVFDNLNVSGRLFPLTETLAPTASDADDPGIPTVALYLGIAGALAVLFVVFTTLALHRSTLARLKAENELFEDLDLDLGTTKQSISQRTSSMITTLGQFTSLASIFGRSQPSHVRPPSLPPSAEFVSKFTKRAERFEVSSRSSKRTSGSVFDDEEDRKEDAAFEGLNISDFYESYEEED